MLPHRLAAALLAACLLLAAAGPADGAVLRNPDGSCMMFPPGSPWRQDISAWPVYSRSRWVLPPAGDDLVRGRPAAGTHSISCCRPLPHAATLPPPSHLCPLAAAWLPLLAPTRASMPTFQAGRSGGPASSTSEERLGVSFCFSPWWVGHDAVHAHFTGVDPAEHHRPSSVLLLLFLPPPSTCSGIPINDVDSSAAKGGWAQFPSRGAISFDMYGDESDPGACLEEAALQGLRRECSASAQ